MINGGICHGEKLAEGGRMPRLGILFYLGYLGLGDLLAKVTLIRDLQEGESHVGVRGRESS